MEKNYIRMVMALLTLAEYYSCEPEIDDEGMINAVVIDNINAEIKIKEDRLDQESFIE
jgi:hypothetical protein